MPELQENDEEKSPVITLTGTISPEQVGKGSYFNLGGTVSTDRGYLTEVYGAILAEDGTVMQECSFSPYTATLKVGETVNVRLKFSTLPEGSYTYLLSATAYDRGKSIRTELARDAFAVVTNPWASPTDETVKYRAKTTDDTSIAGIVWNYFISELQNPYGAAAVLGNMKAESSLNPQMVEGDISGGYFSANYTSLADRGSITREEFATALPGEGYGPGYGLCQWGEGRKGNLYDFAKANGGSVGSLSIQCAFVMQELQTDYPELLEALKTADNAGTAAYRFATVYEMTAIYGARSTYAGEYLEKYAERVEASGSTES